MTSELSRMLRFETEKGIEKDKEISRLRVQIRKHWRELVIAFAFGIAVTAAAFLTMLALFQKGC